MRIDFYSRTFYKRFYRLVAVAVAVMTAVLTGSLLLGDSVRGSLVARVNERLGDTQTLIHSGTGFLSDSILHSDLLSRAKGYLLAEGFVSASGEMIPVTVWGTDNDSLLSGEALVNEELRKRQADASIVLHLPSNNLVGAGSLFISKGYATRLRLKVKNVKQGVDGGNLMLRNEQVRPLNIFLNRRQLAEALGVEGKVNVILSPTHITETDFCRIWRPSYSGLSLLHDSILSTDRVFLSKSLVESMQPKARYLAYFVNSLGTIPYSFVTATSLLRGDETILSDYAARRLNVSVGDSVTMEYYVSRSGLKQLATRSHRFRVSSIVPVSLFQQNAALVTADFPGLSGVQRCTDWNSDLPIDMSRITRADEDYWATCRQTPKALVSLDAVGQDWAGPYGVATRVVVDSLPSAPEGVFVSHPRSAALQAAQNGTDFGVLFLALGFFIIIAAVLLMQNPLAEMYQVRRIEIRLYGVLGFSRRRVFRLLFVEALPVVLSASPVGVLLGYAYAALILWLLAGPWSGATHTDGFALYASPLTVMLSLIATLLLALMVLALTIRKALHPSVCDSRLSPLALSPMPLTHHLLTKASLRYYRRQHRLSFWTLTLGVLIVFAVGLNRPDTDHSSAEATGGYAYYAESRIPIQYDLNTAAGRQHLRMGNWPADERVLQLPKHTEDEASCLNLNRVETPSVLGILPQDMTSFGIDTTAFSSHSAIAVAIDEEALLWSMMKAVGDTLTYYASDGSEVKAVIAATYPTGIFHGLAIMPMEAYRRLWPDEMGSRVLLASSPLPPLGEYGLTVTTTADRLRLFFEVTDTYLSIFMSLGALGLLLGLASLLIVIRKNLAARREEIRLLRTLGYSTDTLVGMLRREQLVVPLLAIVAGAAGCVVISFVLTLTSLLSPLTAHLAPLLTAVGLFLMILVSTWTVIHKSINSKTIKKCETY